MRQLFAFIFTLTFFVPAIGQRANILTVKVKGDSVLKAFIGANYTELRPRLVEIRTTDKNGFYHYFEFTGKKDLIPVSKEYLFTYTLTYPHLNYTARIEFLVNSVYGIADSAGLTSIPEYILKNTERDIILPSEAISIAQANGLAKGDTIQVFFGRHYKTRDYYWNVGSEWKAQLNSERKASAGSRRRASNSRLLVNAKTRKVFTWTEFSEL
ncbi:hypothetical protein [Pseudocnuella soli]|uniref:hypothetical protein n=1 Tax=Pseudocnuella soli TaxID=2502779 RepID=UPI001049463B|nr:hypothetical protein [Pseudocnuella soli]